MIKQVWLIELEAEEKGSAELISDITDHRIESLRNTVTSNGSETSDCQVSDSSNTVSLPADFVASPVFNDPASLTNLTHFGIHNHLINIRKSFLNQREYKEPSKDFNISRLFNKYQIAVYNIVKKHENLPIESYHSEIAEKIFSLYYLKDLTNLPELETMNDSLNYSLTITQTITNLTLNKTTREKSILDLFVLASQLNYGQKRLLLGVINFELWTAEIDLFTLRWTNNTPNEKGKSRPDAVISEKPQLIFGGSVGYGEAKTKQGCCNNLLCLKEYGTIRQIFLGFNRFEDLPSLFTLINIKNLLEINHIFFGNPDNVEGRYKATQMPLDAIIDPYQDSTQK
ncbi:hypothetical protein BD408DRAFT_454747 [Parasitella parasitica]|nr:hypothetical protein BD408DRAFT_454747 [Parasitella parasitica]